MRHTIYTHMLFIYAFGEPKLSLLLSHSAEICLGQLLYTDFINTLTKDAKTHLTISLRITQVSYKWFACSIWCTIHERRIQ
jgi:hypothetical protein